ncbi:MAG: serine/threonine protein kinase [Planctomycetes bacterium]|nr:serine/threonine protein kinase [Planctomycetota bacterium]
MAPHVDRETFLKNLHKSGLLGARELEEALPRLPSTQRGRSLARAMVRMGLLTKFQAERLLAGRTNGFMLGQYRILEQLGQGGMGRVYKAVHQTMNRVVALKILAPHLVRTSKARKLFKNEVQNAGKLAHPNIVTAYDANEMGDRIYLVTEYVNGPNLDQLVRDKGPLPIDLACEIIRQAAIGLEHAHESGMVHRDIKPANLLVQHNPKNDGLTVKILDFGLSRLYDPEKDDLPSAAPVKERTVMGTPDFLSPEQGQGVHDVDIRSDMYSLGCTFYYLLVGRVPFPGGTSLEKLNRHQNEDPVLLENYRPDVPETVADIVRRLMAKDPAKRFQSPQVLADALTPFAAATASYWAVPTRNDADSPAIPSTGELRVEKPSESGPGLSGTMPPDMGATPVSSLGFTPWDTVRDQGFSWKKLILFGISIIGALVGTIALLVLIRG